MNIVFKSFKARTQRQKYYHNACSAKNCLTPISHRWLLHQILPKHNVKPFSHLMHSLLVSICQLSFNILHVNRVFLNVFQLKTKVVESVLADRVRYKELISVLFIVLLLLQIFAWLLNYLGHRHRIVTIFLEKIICFIFSFFLAAIL